MSKGKSKKTTTMRNTNFLISIILLIGLTTNAQYIQKGSSGSQTQKKSNKNGDISVNYSGVFDEGYCKYPKSIYVKYTGLINGKTVDVEYEVSTDVNFTIDKNGGNLLYLGESSDKLAINGRIIQGKEGNEQIITTLTDIIYTTAPKKFTGWIVSKDSKFGVSNTSAISKTGLNSSNNDIAFKGQKVAFFRINKDFSLSFISNPISLEPKSNQNPIKK